MKLMNGIIALQPHSGQKGQVWTDTGAPVAARPCSVGHRNVDAPLRGCRRRRRTPLLRSILRGRRAGQWAEAFVPDTAVGTR